MMDFLAENEPMAVTRCYDDLSHAVVSIFRWWTFGPSRGNLGKQGIDIINFHVAEPIVW